MSGVAKLLNLGVLACLLSAVLSAGPIAPCTTASLSVYLSATMPCAVGALEFGHFAYSNTFFPTLPGPAASAIMVTPSSDPNNPGLDLSAAWSVAGMGTGMDSALTYLVQTISGLPTIDSAWFGTTEDISHSPVNVQVSETLCVGAALGAGKCPAADQISVVVPNGQGAQQMSVSFGPVSELTVSNDIFIRSAGANGNGMISDVGNNFPASVPEPGSPVLVISGLLMLLPVARFGMRRRLPG